MNGKQEQPHYGYAINEYIVGFLIGGGAACVVFALAYTGPGRSPWVPLLCWPLGAILVVLGLLFRLSVGFATDPDRVRLLEESLAEHAAMMWDGRGRVLDIGTGLGRTAIQVAKRFPQARVVGVDTWSRKWGFWGMSQSGAAKNARLEGVSSRCAFEPGDARRLPFPNEEFQLVLSSFVFHEVRVSNRMLLLEEILRVLSPGGAFLVCDTFCPHVVRTYGVETIPEFLEAIQAAGADDVRFVSLKQAGVDLGWTSRVWHPGYVTGRRSTPEPATGRPLGTET